MGEVIHNTDLLMEIMAAYVDGVGSAQTLDGLGSTGLACNGSDTV